MVDIPTSPVKLIMLCPECGSDDVVRDAFASWNVETQKWELSSTYDEFSCNACGVNDIDPDEVPYDCVESPTTE